MVNYGNQNGGNQGIPVFASWNATTYAVDHRAGVTDLQIARYIGKKWKLRVRCSLFDSFHVICKISNFNVWTNKHLAQASCTELTLFAAWNSTTYAVDHRAGVTDLQKIVLRSSLAGMLLISCRVTHDPTRVSLQVCFKN